MKQKIFWIYRLIYFLIALTFSLNPVQAEGLESVLPYIMVLPENENAILVEKNTQMLYIVSSVDERAGAPASETPGFQTIFKAFCSTGEAAGPKEKQGDKKTPEGIYFLTDEYDDKYLTPVYGKKAFFTDYPNFIDQRRGRTGSAIWIHGTDKKLEPRDSNGCIALENKSVMALSDFITLDATPLIIVDRISTVKRSSVMELKDQLTGFLGNWVKTMETGNQEELLSYYDPGYLLLIPWWKEWQELRTGRIDGPITLTLSNIGLYRHDTVFVAIMEMGLVLNNNQAFLGKRKLFIELKDHRFVIIGDGFQKKDKTYMNSVFPIVDAARRLSTKPLDPSSTQTYP